MHKNSLTLATGMTPANQSVFFQYCAFSGIVANAVCACTTAAAGALKALSSGFAPAVVNPCYFPPPALAPQNFQSIFLYMDFTVTLIHTRFHGNKQITQCFRTDSFSGITRLSLASWVRKSLSPFSPTQETSRLVT